jgi:hypothetical protein
MYDQGQWSVMHDTSLALWTVLSTKQGSVSKAYLFAGAGENSEAVGRCL